MTNLIGREDMLCVYFCEISPLALFIAENCSSNHYIAQQDGSVMCDGT